MTEPEGSLSPERAAAVWRRAAQLQAEAAQRLDDRSRTLAAGAAEGDAHAHPHDFTLDEVRAAALEAGIAPEFVALAVSEAGEGSAGLTERQERAAERWLGLDRRSIEVRRTMERPAEEVYRAMQRVLPAAPWHLLLADIAGEPLAGGILTFDVPVYGSPHTTPLLYDALAVAVKQLQVMLRPLPGGAGCELTVRAGLGRSVRSNLAMNGWITGVMGVVGGGAGVGIAAAAGVAGAVLALPAVAGVAALGGLSAWGYKASYRHYLRKMDAELTRMLQAVETHARTGGVFAGWGAEGGDPPAQGGVPAVT